MGLFCNRAQLTGMLADRAVWCFFREAPSPGDVLERQPVDVWSGGRHSRSVRRQSVLERWNAHNRAAIRREAEEYRREVEKRRASFARHSEARRRRADRTVDVEGRRLCVKIRPRFHPSRQAPPNLELWRGLFWSLPARLLRRLVDRDGWTVRIYELNRWPKPRGERLLLKEHFDSEDGAVARAEDLAASLAAGSLRRP